MNGHSGKRGMIPPPFIFNPPPFWVSDPVILDHHVKPAFRDTEKSSSSSKKKAIFGEKVLLNENFNISTINYINIVTI